MTMHQSYLIIWAAFLAYMLGLEFVIDPMMGHPVLWITALMWFAVVETIGIVRKKMGDTLSETIWMFNDGKLGRRVFVGALGAYFAARLFMLGGFPMAYWIPRALLVVGFGVWLTVHFWTRGKKA